MNNKIIKRIGAIVGLIFMSIVGNALWSKFLSPGWDWTVDKSIRGISTVSTSFKTYIYKEAAKGFHEEHSLTLLVLFLGVITGIYIALLISRHILRLEKPREKIKAFLGSHKEFVIFHFLVLVLIVTSFSMIIQSTYSNKIAMKSLNSIEIVSPFVKEKDRRLLKSKFLRIKSCEDYIAFYNKMKSIADKYSLELPLHEPL